MTGSLSRNASHEMQTPLAIIQSKLDRISQLYLSEEADQHLVQAIGGVDRLRRLHRSLLLLARLDNDAYGEKEPVRVDQILKRELDGLEELFKGKEIDARGSSKECTVIANPYLVEVMISNLLSNAFRYSMQGTGHIDYAKG